MLPNLARSGAAARSPAFARRDRVADNPPRVMRASLRVASLLGVLGTIGCFRGVTELRGISTRTTTFMDASPPDAASRPRDAASPPRDALFTDALSRAGARCGLDFECEPLLCFADVVRGGFCSRSCDDGAAFAEQQQCGGSNATCLRAAERSPGFCTVACTPGSASPCRSGLVCTGYWLSSATGDRAGCAPHCSTDLDCGDGLRCHARTGQCAPEPRDESGLADGMPCAPPPTGAPSPCRGQCFRMDRVTGRGICGSVINIAVSSRCPDEPDTIEPVRPADDDLALCLFRRCTATECCPDGLVCEARGGAVGACGIDDPAEPDLPCDRADASVRPADALGADR